MKHRESGIQAAIMGFLDRALPASYRAFAIPNGGKRNAREAGRLRAEGVKPGVSDLLLPLRRHGYAGLWIELKAPGQRPTELQQSWLDRMTLAGYLAEWHDDWRAAADVIRTYVGLQSAQPILAPMTTVPELCKRSSPN